MEKFTCPTGSLDMAIANPCLLDIEQDLFSTTNISVLHISANQTLLSPDGYIECQD